MSMDLMCGSNICAINVIGDPAWVLRALEGLAMLTGSGNIARIAAIGLLVGLIAAALKAILTGGEKFELQNLLVGYILYMALFVPTVNIQIDPLVIRTGYVECGLGCRVDNIPIGAAATGVIISNLGYGIARGFEQAFGTWASTDSQLTTGGFGNGLEAIAAFRNLDQDYIASAGTTEVGKTYDAFRKTLKNYLHDCTLAKLMLGQTTTNAIFNHPNPLEAITFDDGWATTLSYVSPGHRPLDSPVPLTCRAGAERLQSFAPTGNSIGGALQLTDLADAALAARTGTNNVSTRASEFFSVIGAPAAIDMNNYAAASVTAAMVNQAMLEGPMSSERIAGTIMIHQASEQRATQWAAEETMFRRIVTPVISFFEGFLYVVMPFMAFLFGFGASGIGLALKLLQTAIWIQLFAPILAAINLFQVTSMQSYARRLRELNAELGNSQVDFTSIASVSQFQAEAIDWLGVGSMLAAATPAISLMILYGGAVAATHLAGRLQGGDHVNEKIVSPDSLQPAAGLQMSAPQVWDKGGGLRGSGTDSMQYSFLSGSAVEKMLTSRLTSTLQSSDQLSQAVGRVAQNNEQFSNAYTDALSNTAKNVSNSSVDAGFSAMQKQGMSVDNSIRNGVSDRELVKVAMSAGPSYAQGMTLAAGAKALFGALGKVAGNVSGLYSAGSENIDTFERFKAIQNALSTESSQNEGFRATALSEEAKAQATAATASANYASSQTDTTTLQEAASETASRAAALDTALAAKSTHGVSSTITAAQFGELTGQGDAQVQQGLVLLESRLASMDLGKAVGQTQQQLQQMGMPADNAHRAAMLMTTARVGSGAVHIPDDVDEGQLSGLHVYALSLAGRGAETRDLLAADIMSNHNDNLAHAAHKDINRGAIEDLTGAIYNSDPADNLRREVGESVAPANNLTAPKTPDQVRAEGDKATMEEHFDQEHRVIEADAQLRAASAEANGGAPIGHAAGAVDAGFQATVDAVSGVVAGASVWEQIKRYGSENPAPPEPPKGN